MNLDQALEAFQLELAQRAGHKSVAERFFSFAADEATCSKVLVEAFQPRSQVNILAKRCVIHPLLAPKVTHIGNAGVQPNPGG